MSTRMPLLACPRCGAKNRVPAARLAHRPVCGRCAQGLPGPAEVIDLDADAFAEVITHPDLPVIVDFWAPWCGPCRTFAPVLGAFAEEAAGRAVTAKLNVDEAPGLAARYGIRGIPTVAVFRRGREVARRSGALPPRELERLVEEGSL